MTARCSRRERSAGWLVLLGALLLPAGCGKAPAATNDAYQPLQNRAYSGAPPLIPHEVTRAGRQECLSCHLHGDARIAGGQLAKRTPHPELSNCVSCHVERKTVSYFKQSAFDGKSYTRGLRSQPQGPLLIGHPLTMRENCLGCHDTPRTPPELRVTHPERSRCLQCHLPAYEGFPGPRSLDPQDNARFGITWSL